MIRETTVLANLIYNEPYVRKALPYLKAEYFNQSSQKIAFELISKFIERYNAIPTKNALQLMLDRRDASGKIKEKEFQETKTLIASLQVSEQDNIDFLVNETETFCKDRALELALLESIKIHDDKDNPNASVSTGTIPDILREALSVSFDQRVGHDYLEDAKERYDSYFIKETKIPFDLDIFNKITDGGLATQTLTIFMAGTNGGKSRMMCHMAAANLRMGYDVLYITLEMSERLTAKRIDCNLLNINIKDLANIPWETFNSRLNALKSKTAGRLVVKKFPAGGAHVGHFKHLLNELSLKKNFQPKIIYIDYMNLCGSSRLKKMDNSYGYVKAISEEFHGLASDYNIPVVTATQLNRQGMNSSDFEMTDVSESIGVAFTADYIFGLINTPDLDGMNKIIVKQLKQRDGDINYYNRFAIGVDKFKFKHYDLEDSAQKDLIDPKKGKINEVTTNNKLPTKDDKPVFDSSKFSDWKIE